MSLPLQCRVKQNFLFDTAKSIEYLASAVIAVSSNHCICCLPRTKISFPYYQDVKMNNCLQNVFSKITIRN